MTKDLFIKLCEELGRDPTDDEMADAASRVIDGMDWWEYQDEAIILSKPKRSD